jgi:PKD repeat protein/photosystem II stability/assembly factor-like uncharacterized protein
MLLLAAPVLAGQNRWTRIGPLGGRVTDLELYEAGATRLLAAGTSGGGVFLSTDDGASWSMISDNLVSGFVTRLAAVDVGGSQPRLFAATLQPGLQRAPAPDEPWELLQNEVSELLLRDIAAPDAPAGWLYVATAEDGVWRSQDDGASFSPVNNGLTIPYVLRLVCTPDFLTTQTLFAGTIAGIFRSTDQGDTWEQADQGVTDPVIMALAVSPNYALDQTVFAGGTTTVFRSTDGGEQWEALDIGAGTISIRAIALSPGFATDRLVMAATAGAGIYRSTDGGDTWEPYSTGLIDSLVVDVVLPAKPDPTARGWAGTDGHGVHRLVDPDTWQVSNEGMTATRIQAVDISPPIGADRLVLAGALRGLFYRSWEGSWTPIDLGVSSPDVRWVAFSPDYDSDETAFVATLSDGCFRTTSGMDGFTPANNGLPSPDTSVVALSPAFTSDRTVFLGTAASGLFRSTNAGEDWRNIPSIPVDATILDVELSDDFVSDRTLFAGTAAGKLYRSTDGGETFEPVLTITDPVEISAVALSPRFSSSRVAFAGTYGGGILRSTDGGDSWAPVPSETLSPYIRDILVHPDFATNQTVLAATYTGGCFRSEDAGLTWEPFNLGLTSARMIQIRYAPDELDGGTYIAGTGGGSAVALREVPPRMVGADPAEGAVIFDPDHPVTLTFDQMMDPDSLELEIEPPLTIRELRWSPFNDRVTLVHEGFQGNPTEYRFTVVEARDRRGLPVVDDAAPLSWAFTVDRPPQILAAGLWNTDLTTAGGAFTLLAVALDSDIDRLEVAPGVLLWDDGTNGDWGAGDGLFTLALDEVGGGIAPAQYTLPITAYDNAGQASTTWPWLAIGDDPALGRTPADPAPWARLGLPPDQAHAPRILLGGYWDSRLTVDEGGMLTILAYVSDPDGLQDIAAVELYYQGLGTGVLLNDEGRDGDWTPGDGLYMLELEIPAGYGPLELLLEIVARDQAGNESDPWPYLTVHALPLSLEVSAEPAAGVAPLDVHFEGTVSGGTPPYVTGWTFGDGATADGDAADHRYASPGTYTATFTVEDAAGETAARSTVIRVARGDPLEAAFTAEPAEGQAPLEVAFIGSAEGGVPPYTAFRWDFGDGGTAQTQRANHTFTAPGTFTVTLEVEDSSGAVATAQDQIVIHESPPPQVLILADPTEGEPPLTVQFDASVDGGQAPYRYRWDFDTATPGSADADTPNPRYTFSNGVFNVTLEVTDAWGASSSAAVTVTAADLPQCDHLVDTEVGLETAEILTATYKVALSEVQTGDEVTLGLYAENADEPCFAGTQVLAYPFRSIDLTLSVFSHPDACELLPGTRWTFKLQYNGVECPAATRSLLIP